MSLIVQQAAYRNLDSIDNFLNFYYTLQMQHLASDLLEKGLSSKQVSKAVVRVLRIAKLSGIEVHKNFMSVFSGIDGAVVQDCKLSDLAYGLAS